LDRSEDVVSFPSNFLDELDRCVEKTSNAHAAAVWGAAAKGVMFSHHLSRREKPLDFAIDINPAKQGKFLGRSALPVLSPKDGIARLKAGDDVFVMNSNSIHEISNLGGNHLNYISVDRK
jgi:hypothetical protein